MYTYVPTLEQKDRMHRNSNLYLEALSERLTKVFGDLVDTDAPHRPHGQRTDEGVGVLTVLGEGVDGQDGEVRLRLGIVHKVEVDQLLQLKVVCLHTVDHVRKEGAVGWALNRIKLHSTCICTCVIGIS